MSKKKPKEPKQQSPKTPEDFGLKIEANGFFVNFYFNMPPGVKELHMTPDQAKEMVAALISAAVMAKSNANMPRENIQ